jgi:hypothetical protein
MSVRSSSAVTTTPPRTSPWSTPRCSSAPKRSCASAARTSL